MRRTIIAAAAALLMATAAQAAQPKIFTLHQGKYWQTFASADTAENTGPQCTMYYGGDYARFYIKWTERNGLRIHMWKSNWRLAENSTVPFAVDFIDHARPDERQQTLTIDGWAEPSRAGGTSVFAGVTAENSGKVLAEFSEADQMIVRFPEGDEPAWTLQTEGTRKAAAAFRECISITQRSSGTQPVKPKATQPVTPKATQPAAKPAKKDNGSV